MTQVEDNRDAKGNDALIRAREIVVALLPIAVFCIPLTSNTVAESRFSILTVMVAIALLVMFGAALAIAIPDRSIRESPTLLAGFVLTAAMWISFAWSPSGPGLILTVFATGSLGLLISMTLLDEDELRSKVAAPLLAASSIQAVLIIIQTLTDRAIGLTLFDGDAELRVIDGLLRSPGTMHHVYEPAALALGAAGVAIVTSAHIDERRKWLWAGSVALAGATIGLTHSRSALLGLLLMAPFVALAARQHRTRRIVTASFMIGFLVAAALTSSAWLLRGDHTLTGDLDDMSLGRVTLMKQAVEMAIDHPLVGVGPGRYLDAMRADYELDPDHPFIVHNVSLAIAAENGILAAILVTALVGWALTRATRSGLIGAALALSISGFLVFDALHYNRPVGLMLGAIWLGALHIADPRNQARSDIG